MVKLLKDILFLYNMKEKVDEYYLLDIEIKELSKQLAEKKKEQAKLNLELIDKTYCKKCNKHFSSWKYYFKHCISVHKPSFECNICRKKFKCSEEKSKHNCVCGKWFINTKHEIKQCTKIFTSQHEYRNHKCSGFKSKEQAEQALKYRTKNRVKSASECSEEKITIEVVKKFDEEKPRMVSRELLDELEEAGIIYNASRQWNTLLEPFIEEYLEKSEILVYYKKTIYGDCYSMKDFDEETSPIEFVIYNDEFRKSED